VDEHRLQVKIYLEDTDAQGIVYHANYLKYCERARTEIVGLAGRTLGEMQAAGCRPVVHEMRLKFHKPAVLHDLLEVRTTVSRASPYRATFRHAVHRAGEEAPLFSAEAQIVAVDTAGELVELPHSFPGDE
jgi:tol-pal system-associated acyl-CoA thioesterase